MKANQSQEKPRKYAEFAKNFNLALDAAGYPGLHYGRQVKVGEAFDISPSAARKWVMGDCLPDHDNLLKICDTLKVGLDALFGRLPHFGNSPMVGIPISVANHGQKDGDWKEIFSSMQIESNWIETGLRMKSDGLFVMQVRGDNMFPTIGDGDSVFVDNTPVLNVLNVENNGIYLIMANGRPQIRRIQVGLDDVVLLTSDNKHFPPLTVKASAFTSRIAGKDPSLKILGRIPWVIHRVGRGTYDTTEAAVSL